MTIKNLLDKYHYFEEIELLNEGKINKLTLDCFTVFFPKIGIDISKAKTFDIDYLDPIETRYPQKGISVPDNYHTGIPVALNFCYEKITSVNFTDLSVIYFKFMETDELKKSIFKYRLWSKDDELNFFNEKWLCILAYDNKMS